MPVTIREVAQAAGVSAAAVSKVLHGRGETIRVGAERAAMIRQVARELDYRPNAIARNLRSSRTNTIGLVWENIAGLSSGPLYFAHLLEGLMQEIRERHYRLTILPEIPHDRILDALGDGQLEGVIWCKFTQEPEMLQLVEGASIPIVALNTPTPVEPTKAFFVSCDNNAGIELAVAHLWELGHRRILFLSEHEEQAPDCLARRAAFVDAMVRRGVSDPYLDVEEWGWDADYFVEWWASTPAQTAILCWSERLAGAVLNQAVRAGVSVPKDLSVVGFDSTQYCESTQPRLTAVAQPITEMAIHASRTLFSLIAGEKPEQISTLFPCTFDVRDSTAKPRNTHLANAKKQL